MEFARSVQIDSQVLDFSAEAQPELVEAIKKQSPSAVVTNVHKILTKEVVTSFAGKLINLHYSLLPAFQGTIGVRPVRQAMAYGAKFAGVTAHHVDEGVDTGRPLAQAVIPVMPDDQEHELMDIVFRCGCLTLLTGLQETLQPGSTASPCKVMLVKDRRVMFNPVVYVGDDFSSDAFWNNLKN